MNLLPRIEALSEQPINACNQCGKCSGSCPLVRHMDLLPRAVMHGLQVSDERVLQANTPWLCATCFTCTVRCPKGVDFAAVMEALRQLVLRKNIDKTTLRKIPPNLPQVAVVGALRKLTG